MYLPTSLPSSTEWALRRRSDSLLATCFVASALVHILLGFLLARVRWSAPPPPRFTEVRLLKPTPAAPPPAAAAAPSRVTTRPKDLSLYLKEPAPEPPRRRGRRARRARSPQTPPVVAARTPVAEPPAGEKREGEGARGRGGERTMNDQRPTTDTSPDIMGRSSFVGGRSSLPRGARGEERGDAPQPVKLARRERDDALPSRQEPGHEPAPLPAAGAPAEREPVAARGAARRGEGALATLPELPPGEGERGSATGSSERAHAPRVLTGPDRAEDGAPEAAPVVRPGERPRQRARETADAAVAGRRDSPDRPATEPEGGDLPEPARLAAPAGDDGRSTPEERRGAGRSGGGDRSPVPSVEGRRIAELPFLSREEPAGGAAPAGRTASGEPDGDGEGPRRLERGPAGRRGAGAAQGDAAGVGAGRAGEGDAGEGAGPLPGVGGLGEGGRGDGPGLREGSGAGDRAPGRIGAGGLPGKGTAGGVYVSTTGRYLLPGAVTGSDYMFHVNALNTILDEINSRTKLQVRLGRQYLRIQPGGFRQAPVVVFTGHRAFSLNDEQRLALRQYVEGGGMLWADLSGDAFDESFRKEMEQIFGKRPVSLPSGHAIYRSFYVLDSVPPGDLGGRAAFEGITLGDRLAVVITPNRYFAAVGGPPRVTEEVQEGALRVAVNIYVYGAAHYRAERE